MTLGETVSETNATVLPNPKIRASTADYKEQQMLLRDIEAMIQDIHESVNAMRSAKKQIKNYEALLKERTEYKELTDLGQTILKGIDEWERKLIQPDQKTFQDVINFNNKLSAQLMHLKGYIDVPEPQLTAGAKLRFTDLKQEWNALKTEHNAIIGNDMVNYNNTFKRLGLSPLIILD